MLFTGMLVSLGSGSGGGGASTFLAMIWTGLAPGLAIVAIHIVFVKFLKMPSPVTPSGLSAWVGGAGTSGAGIQSGMKQLGQKSKQALSGKNRAKSDETDREASKLTPTAASQAGIGTNERPQKMAPAKANNRQLRDSSKPGSGSQHGMSPKDAKAEAKAAKQFGKKTAADRKAAGKLQAKNAMAEQGVGKYLAAKAVSGAGNTAKSAGKATASAGSNAWNSLRDNGIRSTAGMAGKKLAKAGGFGAAMVGATAIGGVPGAAALGGGYLAAKKGGPWVREHLSAEGRRNQRAQQVQAYRDHRDNMPDISHAPAKPDYAPNPAASDPAGSAGQQQLQPTNVGSQPQSAPQSAATTSTQSTRQRTRPEPQQKVPRPHRAGGGKPNPHSQTPPRQ